MDERFVEPTIINIKKKWLNKIGIETLELWLENENNIYIGRSVGWVKGALKSPWANPFAVKKYGIDDSLELYEAYVRETLWDNLVYELSGKTMGCWCHPSNCHGDVLIKLWKEKLSYSSTM